MNVPEATMTGGREEMSMISKEYTVRFVTPAFLGDAEQRGAWRTPPFKTLLRQWWRVAVAKQCNRDWAVIREKEGRLFGHAWLDDQGKKWAMKSQMQVKLDNWRSGTKTVLEKEETIRHPEVSMKDGKVDPLLYLGYGPLTYDKETKATELKMQNVIEANDTAQIAMIWPNPFYEEMELTLKLVQTFGTIGGRSRNGWGSVTLAGNGIPSAQVILEDAFPVDAITRPLEDCLKEEWPHAIGEDSKGVLCWKTKAVFDSWKRTMRELARIKIKFRTGLTFKSNDKINPRLNDRHILGYPVTHHGVDAWSKERLANQLRFKVLQSDEKKYIGIAFQLPCGLPFQLIAQLKEKSDLDIVRRQQSIWRNVHEVLDVEMDRIKAKGGKA